MREQKREHLRFTVESTTFIELEAPAVGQTDTGVLVAGKTLNISRRGLLVSVEQEVPVGAILQLGVDLSGTEDTLYLVGEVRWCLPAKNATDDKYPWYAAYRLLNAHHTDIERWVELLVAMEGEDPPP